MTFAKLLQGFQGKKALVVGDLMLDEYIFGRATRISPEAPVMVVRQQRTARLPGGAANVARNLLAFGAETHVLGVAGCDAAGDLLEASLREQGLTHVALARDPARPTTRKTRVLADHTHQVIRIDEEEDIPLSQPLEEQLLAQAERRLELCDVVVLSDYLKGCLTPKLCSELISKANSLGKPVVVNPKPFSLGQYRGANLISLNRSETTEAIGERKPVTADTAQEAATVIQERYGVESVLVTMGEEGMIASGPETFRIPAPRVEVSDPAGAGDTVIATVALGLATAGFAKEVFELAAQTSACVVRHVGVATPSAEDLEQIKAL